MRVYVDSSVVLRVVLGESNRLQAPRITTAVNSELIRVECLRVLDASRSSRSSSAHFDAPKATAFVRRIQQMMVRIVHEVDGAVTGDWRVHGRPVCTIGFG